MLLAIDIGNTRLKWGLFSGEVLHDTGTQEFPVSTNSGNWAGLGMLPPPDRVAIASVGGESRFSTLQSWLTEKWGCPVLRLRSTAQAAGVFNAYRDPKRLGVDRWAALVAARSLSSKPVIVIDVGSACTIDVMDGTGRHKGGWIAPGLRLMESALLKGTQEITLEGSEDRAAWGTDTRQGVRAGIEAALLGLIERSARRLEEEENEPVECVMTGGDGHHLKSLIELPCVYDPALVLKGVALLVSDERYG